MKYPLLVVNQPEHSFVYTFGVRDDPSFEEAGVWEAVERSAEQQEEDHKYDMERSDYHQSRKQNGEISNLRIIKAN